MLFLAIWSTQIFRKQIKDQQIYILNTLYDLVTYQLQHVGSWRLNARVSVGFEAFRNTAAVIVVQI